MAVRARTWLYPRAFGSQSQARPGGRSLEAGTGLSWPQRRQRCAGGVSSPGCGVWTHTAQCAQRRMASKHTLARSLRPALPSPANANQWQRSTAQPRQRLVVPHPASAVKMLTDTPAASWGRAQRADVLARGQGLPTNFRTTSSNPLHGYKTAAPIWSRKQILSGPAAWTCLPEP